MSEQEIFESALERDAESRARYLDEACGNNSGLRQRIEVLLRFHSESGEYFEKPAAEIVATLDQPITEQPGTQIGRYKLREVIGEGGFGVVYVAEQKEPVSRKVALKVIKPGMDSRDIIARFEAERQALAMMNHPNVARVLDAGATESGRPYFVMELVRGLPITEFCDSKRLTNRQRLELFVDVCHAVQHAHQKGIIHRDLKPSNVLVTMADHRPIVKVIDFGVAKALHHDLTDNSIYTGYGQMIGTPMYMSPEQAQLSSLDVDTRSDIYSLGVLLYELLTGTTPFDKETFKAAGFDEMRRMIREVEPRRPSEQVSTLKAEQISTISDCHNIDQRSLSKFLRGDLDWIVMKALEKDRTRRYETANALAADVHRFLDDEPVVACPPSRFYRFRKFARRNQVGLAFASLTTLFLVAGVIGLAASNYLLGIREKEITSALEIADKNLKRANANYALAEQNEKIANTRAKEAELQTSIANSVQDFFNRQIIANANPRQQRKNVTLVEVLDLAGKSVGSRFPGQPLVEAQIRENLCEAYNGLGENDKALFHVKKAVEICQRQLGANAEQTLSAKSWQVYLEQLWIHDRKARRSNMAQLVKTCEEYLGKDNTVTQRAMNWLATTYGLNSDKSADIWQWLIQNSVDDELKIKATFNLANSKMMRSKVDKDVDEALSLFKFTFEEGKAILGEDNFLVVSALSQFGMTSIIRGDWENGYSSLKEARQRLIATLGMSDPMTVLVQCNLASASLRIGLLDDARDLAQEIVDLPKPPSDIHRLSDCHMLLSQVLARRGDNDGAEKAAKVAIAVHDLCVEEGCERGLFYRTKLAIRLGESKRFAEQREVLVENIRQRENAGSESFDFAVDLELLSAACQQLKKNDEAQDFLVRLNEILDGLSNKPAESNLADPTKLMIMKCEAIARMGNYRSAAHKISELQKNIPNHNRGMGEIGSHWPHCAAVLAICARVAMQDASLTDDEKHELSEEYIDQSIQCLRNIVKQNNALDTDVLWYIENCEDLNLVREHETFQIVVEQLKSIVAKRLEKIVSPFTDDGKVNNDKSEHFDSTFDDDYRIAMMHHLSGRFAEEEQVLRQLLEKLDHRTETHDSQVDQLALVCNNLAWNLVTRPRAETSSYSEAIDLAKRAVSLAPKRYEYLSTLGSCQHRLGNWRDAIESLTKSLDLAKGEQESFITFFLAMAYWKADEKDAARQCLERAVRWMDSNAPYDERLLRLRNEAENVVAGTDG